MSRIASPLGRLATTGLLVVAALSPAAAQGGCDAPVSPDELARVLSTADAAFTELDADTFTAALVQARRSIPCLSAPLNTSVAASYHRAEAFQAFLDRDHAGVVQHFRAMLVASPGYILSELVAPEGHPLRTDFEIAEGLPPSEIVQLTAPETGTIWIDGHEGTDAPVALPYVFQLVDDTGAVSLTRYTEVGSALPAYDAQAEGRRRRSESTRSTASSDRKRRLGPPLVAAAVVSGVASASLYAMSSERNNQFWDPATADGDLDRLRSQTNSLAYASLATGIVAVGTGTAAVITFAW